MIHEIGYRLLVLGVCLEATHPRTARILEAAGQRLLATGEA